VVVLVVLLGLQLLEVLLLELLLRGAVLVVPSSAETCARSLAGSLMMSPNFHTTLPSSIGNQLFSPTYLKVR
jgi:hypothetical protein